jgi:signal transduction histidine kinase
MKFKVTARTLLHLGAELISSDGIALYELIKNAFDARSPNVRIDIHFRIPHRLQKRLVADLTDWEGQPKDKRLKPKDFLAAFKKETISFINLAAPEARAYRKEILEALNAKSLHLILRRANRIVVTDRGRGMSSDELVEAFLTIGTRNKQRSKSQIPADEVVLGEKGIGRFSAMRLGSFLKVTTTKAGLTHWNELALDWSQLSHDSDALLSDLDMSPERGSPKSKPGTSGTIVEIDDLNRDWTLERATRIAETEFAKLNDPFSEKKRFPISLHFNTEMIPIPGVSSLLLRAAQATAKGRYAKAEDGKWVLTVEFSYLKKVRAFSFKDEELLSLTEEKEPDVLGKIGEFEFDFYWYNRRLLTSIEGVGDLAEVKQTLEKWSGGLLLYRDGFRVLPYGGPDDDWLGVDRKALSRSGFKVNRTQLVGRVAISSSQNPYLVDQSNREGLRDGDEKRAFVEMLQYIVRQTFYDFLQLVDRDKKKAAEPIAPDEIEDRLEKEEDRISRNLQHLVRSVPALKAHEASLTEIRGSLESFRTIMGEVRQMADTYEEGRGQLLNLAGIGLTVEILAHEINRVTDFALRTLGELATADFPAAVEKTLSNLAVQLKTLQKRMRFLDPLSTSGRNRKERFDLIEMVRDIVVSHGDQFAREGIAADVVIEPNSAASFPISAVKGMIVQVLENLISNSVYWLRHRKTLNPDHAGAISIKLDLGAREISFTDNGPGIPPGREDLIFQAFFTTKPAGQGKGLGLFIAHEIAKYHSASLRLEGPDADGNFRTFVLALESAA